jgi:hypothetical protein
LNTLRQSERRTFGFVDEWIAMLEGAIAKRLGEQPQKEEEAA